jgi:protein-disulfide isomerase
MSKINWRKYTTPGAILGILFSTLVIVGLGLFSLQVGKNVWRIASGAPNPFAKTQLELNVSSALVRGSLDKTSSARIESAAPNPMLGNPDAALRLVEFLDYECLSSKQALSEVRAFIAHHPNDVLLILRDYPLENDHPNALNAALAARCVFNQGQADRFWAYHDLLFKNQTQLSLFDLRRYAEQVGADVAAYDTCLRLRQTESVVRQSLADGAAIGVLGTPTFFFNTFRIPGALDLAAFELIYQKIQEGI